MGPCSEKNNDFEAEYIDVAPGPLTLRFEESIVHTNAPSIVSLNEFGNKDETCLLLDHIPHNNAGKMNLGPDCWIDGYPMGRCQSQNYVTVNIPDIKCEKCFLQIISVMLDKYTAEQAPCFQRDMGFNNCSTYYTCANVRLRPTKANADKTFDTCKTQYQENLIGDWPYQPADAYQSQVSTGNIKAEGTFILGSMSTSDLHYNISLENFASNFELAIAKNENPIHIITVPRGSNIFQASWYGLSPENIKDLKAGSLQLMITVRIGSSVVQASSPIKFSSQVNKFQYYYHLGVDFTEQGWIKGKDFVGSNARYPFINEPHGHCIPETKYFGAFEQYSGETIIVTATVTDERVWIRAVSRNSRIATIQLKFDDAILNIGSSDVTVGNAVYQTYELPKKSFETISADVVLVTSTEKSELSLMKRGLVLQEGISTPLQRNYRDYIGEVFIFRDGANFKYAAVALPGPTGSAIQKIQIRGPARQGHSGPVMFDLSTSEEGISVGSLAVSSIDFSFVQASGHLYAELTPKTLQTNTDRQINGQFPVGDLSFSNSARLTVNGEPLDIGQPGVDTNGFVSFFKNGASFEIKGMLRNVLTGEQLETIQLRSIATNEVLVSDSNIISAKYNELEDKTLKFEKVWSNVPQNVADALSNGDLKVHMLTSRHKPSPLVGIAPTM